MTPSSPPIYRRLGGVTSHLVVAVIALVVIGGATRVMEAGLACPDWPLCFGTLLPGRQMNLQVFLEWFHRLTTEPRAKARCVAPSTCVCACTPSSTCNLGEKQRIACTCSRRYLRLDHTNPQCFCPGTGRFYNSYIPLSRLQQSAPPHMQCKCIPLH